MDLRNLLEQLVKKMAWKHQDQNCRDLLEVVDARSGKAMLTLLKVMLMWKIGQRVLEVEHGLNKTAKSESTQYLLSRVTFLPNPVKKRKE